jgi:5-methylcytosine-specific restriction protein A
MPKRLKPCATSGCPTLTHTTRCPKHAKEKRRREDKRRPSARARGYNRQHEKDRKAYFAMYPVCQWEEGCIEPAEHLDHIDGDPFNKSWKNYRGYCAHHHMVRTARDQPGGWNDAAHMRGLR